MQVPKARKFAREIGADLHLIEGSQREGRINEEDIKTFVKNLFQKKFKKEKKFQYKNIIIQNLVKLIKTYTKNKKNCWTSFAKILE